MNEVDDEQKNVRKRLQDARAAAVYRNTAESIVSRIMEDGCFPESVAEGGYGAVMFLRTTGALVPLLMEWERFDLAERVLTFAFESRRRMGLARMPHIAFPPERDGAGNVISQQFSRDDQPDGTLHVLCAWSALVLSGRASGQMEEYYQDAAHLLDILMDQPYFYYQKDCPSDVYPYMFPPESLKLVFNCALEHSRENRRWSAFDLLTQCFAGAALEKMALIAQRLGDMAHASFWRNRQELLREGVEQFLTREVEGRRVYLEMRLPDGGWGRPYAGVSWINYAPVAAEWEPLSSSVLENTVALVRDRLWREAASTGGCRYLATSIDEEGSINPNVAGKLIAWDMMYCMQHGEYDRIDQWLEFVSRLNATPLLAENFVLQPDGWTIADAGNGEQCCWWCLAMARLRRKLGLPAWPA